MVTQWDFDQETCGFDGTLSNTDGFEPTWMVIWGGVNGNWIQLDNRIELTIFLGETCRDLTDCLSPIMGIMAKLMADVELISVWNHFPRCWMATHWGIPDPFFGETPKSKVEEFMKHDWIKNQ